VRDAGWALAAAVAAVLACWVAGAAVPPRSPPGLVPWFAVVVCLVVLPRLGIWPGVLASAGVAAGCLALGASAGSVPVLALLALAVGQLCALALRAARMETGAVAEGGAPGR